MFVVVHRYRVRPGEEARFEKTWAELTELSDERAASLGSTLFRGRDGYVALAQWPSRAAYQRRAELGDEGEALRLMLKGLCSAIETVDELEVVNDLSRRR